MILQLVMYNISLIIGMKVMHGLMYYYDMTEDVIVGE